MLTHNIKALESTSSLCLQVPSYHVDQLQAHCQGTAAQRLHGHDAAFTTTLQQCLQEKSYPLAFLLSRSAICWSPHGGALLCDQYLSGRGPFGLLDVSGGCHDDRALALPLALGVPGSYVSRILHICV